MDYKKLDLPNTNYPNQEQLKAFETAFNTFLETNQQENENHHNDAFNDLLKSVFKYKVKPTKKIDSAILNENNKVEVIIEFKALKNPNEFIKKGDLNVKAFHESLLYYLTERKEGNNNLKHLILATIKELYIIDANEFEIFNKDKEIKKAFENCHDKKGNDPRTKAFYDVCQKHLNELDHSLKYHHIPLKKENLALIYQALSPNFLLKIPKYSDANTLNKDFYEELLYILGLEEQNEKGKTLIKPSHTQNSLSDALKEQYKNLDDEEVMALLIAWNNRILFLRLLESLLISFNHFEDRFLTTENFKDFNDLNTLFFEVLAKKNSERSLNKENKILEKIPYLNSSLFDQTPLELKGHEIGLLNNKPLEIYPKSVLKKHEDYQKEKDLPLLKYLFEFLRLYKFTTTPKDIKDKIDTSESRLINPSVLGLVFEKLNGYKEGSFYTPSFITSYMCKESIEPIVRDKFNATYQWHCKDLEALREKIDRNFSNEKAKEYLNTLLTLRICDPAVGSGHFLVSALNEMVWVAYELGLIASLYRHELRLENDEIIIHTPEYKELKEKFDSNEYIFSDEELECIIEISPQNHKEMGFEHGWESRFDTWYKLMCEFGFCYYAKYEKILISDSAKMLILAYYDKENDAFKESVDESVVGAIFLNALSKYEARNPYKKNLNHNNPFKLLLSLLKRLKNAHLTPLSVKEIPILLCWKDDNANGLYDCIIHLRQEVVTINKTEFSYSDEFIYEKCLNLLESVNKTRFKMSQITNEAVDEYIRKMRITGLISLRGNGKFIDINTNENNKIDYILQTHKAFKGDYLNDTQANKLAFFNYMSIVDSFLVNITPISANESVKSSKLNELATTYTKDFIKQELLITCNKQESKDSFLRLIDKPLRLEFLSAIFLKQHFENLSVIPNYKSDDEGLPIYTASGNKPDIVAMDTKAQSYIEVSLIRDRSQSKMISVARHLKELIKNSADIREKFSVFVTPNIHNDAKEYVGFAQFKNNINIRCYAINDFIKKAENNKELLQLNGHWKA